MQAASAASRRTEPDDQPDDEGDEPVQRTSGKKVSRKLIVAIATMVIAGGAYALVPPVTKIIKKKLGAAIPALATDSLQLAPNAAAAPQLQDVPATVPPPDLAAGSASVPAGMPMPPEASSLPEPVQERAQPAAQSAPAPTRVSRSVPAAPRERASAPRVYTPPTYTPRPSTSAATAEERPAAPTSGRIASGSTLSLRSADQVCTDGSREGARFRAVTQDEVVGSNGVRIPQGTFVTFVVSKLARAGGNVEFAVLPESIEIQGTSQPLSGTTDTVAIKAKKRALFGALVGAAVGAAATKAAGGDTKQAIAGSVVGAAAGAAVGNRIISGDGCIERNALLRITTRSDLTLKVM